MLDYSECGTNTSLCLHQANYDQVHLQGWNAWIIESVIKIRLFKCRPQHQIQMLPTILGMLQTAIQVHLFIQGKHLLTFNVDHYPFYLVGRPTWAGCLTITINTKLMGLKLGE